jgi:uncharacterized protein (TIGR03663 family)
MMNRWSVLALLLAIAGALALRLPRLDTRPLHNDEAVNAVKVNELWQHGRYAYDPHEYHGPTLHYLSLPFFWLSGARTSDQLSDTILRLAPVTFGVGLILLLLLFADGLGRHALSWAAFFTAVSPAMVFYSRYFIHEMFLVFFTALTIGAGWRYHQTRLARWAVVAGAGIGLMWATKETFVLAMAAMAVAVVGQVSRLPKSLRPSRLQAGPAGETPAGTAAGGDACPTNACIRHAALALLAAFVVWLVLFSSFFHNWRGLADSVLTYLPWLERAGGSSPHIHPWSFYLERLAWFQPAKSPVWSEGLILALAAVGGGVSLFGRKTPLHRFLALYTIVLTIIYCIISYKTPWCLLGFFHGMILLAGVGAAALVEIIRSRALKTCCGAILVALSVQLAWEAGRASFIYPADRRNPYVYAQTVPDILNLVARAEGIARVAPDGYGTVVKVIAPESDYWPLPWYLRRFNHIGWFEQLPADPFSPIVIVSAKLNSRLDDQSEKKWIMAGISELRPGTFLEMYVELELWKKYVATLPREVD